MLSFPPLEDGVKLPAASLGAPPALKAASFRGGADQAEDQDSQTNAGESLPHLKAPS